MVHSRAFLSCFVLAAACTAGNASPAVGGASSDHAGTDDGGDGDDDHGVGDGGTDDSPDAEDDAGTDGPSVDGVIVTDLVGHALQRTPHLRVVDNFNDDEPVVFSVDASRHGREGAECDVYVVAARPADAWEADASLSDAREGGPTRVTLAASLADNVTVVAEAGALSSATADGVGVPYDVVADCDLDGMLSDGDLIDGLARPGLFRTHDITEPGPAEVAVLSVDGGRFRAQRIFYPADVADRGALPLVVVTHGWSYTYEYYDYIGEHLASYGYVVMIHEANVQDGGPPGTETAAQDALGNLDRFLDRLTEIGAGVLDDHVDARRIMLTGHSTGGEAVVRAATMLRSGDFVSPHFGYDDLRVISSMAPVSWLPRADVDPGEIPYHMFIAGADDDVSGAPIPSYTQSRSIYERARGDRQLTTIHGAGHGDLLDCCGPLFVDTNAPALIGREATKGVARGVFLALAEAYLRDNPAALEFLVRPYAEYHPPGIGEAVVVTNEYRRTGDGVVVLDDFEDGDASLSTSSAGTAVTLTASNAAEVLMQDNDGSFAWSGDQPSNGMTHARHPGDTPHALVFDFSAEAEASYEVALPGAAQDMREAQAISLRACQGTRHPQTVALGGPLAFTVSLVDEAGEVGSVPIDGPRAIPAPYARAGEGPGVGWGNEFSSLQIPIAEFVGDNPALDLSAVAVLRLSFGARFGSPQGRVGVDDLEVVY